ncbi:cytochrome P450 [Pyrrhoderma noxium]|uniref:Cytochrome P450 n=1 Tax=Pyrrhoderma noxium TaxID=2282107 RepID=A0A286UQB0_9AGAM|nr:cytochrome P450 [Pyrrhoderma noxium]
MISEIKQGNGHIDVMSWMIRVTLECIGQGGLEHSFSSLEADNGGNIYEDAIKRMLPLSFRAYILRDLIFPMHKLGITKFWGALVHILPFRLPKEIQGTVDAVGDASIRELKKKKATFEKGGNETEDLGKDIINILLKENLRARITEDEVVGHTNSFLVAAVDTTSNALSRMFWVLAENPDVQSKLRDEIVTTRKERGNFDYDTLQALPYLDAVCRETLRVYPPVSSVIREALKDTVIPLQFPIRSRDGSSEIDEVFVPKGTEIYISILAANRSKRIWGEDAEEWKPSRWLEALPKSISDAHVPGVYSPMMTFAGGGRSCIGFKFSEMEMKLVLAVLVETFIFEPGVGGRYIINHDISSATYPQN